ncbi:hypothetical protein AYK24_04515 [Thermoplasmatales archaeon SG8-52-4]|nr:MAG: hypothetical protein AYK24_04515 [Thermoplasmatales archaeon SG8-52-4]
MKKTVLIICLIFVFQTAVTGSLNNTFSKNTLESKNLYDINWEKHIIDNTFDYAFGVHAFDVDLDGNCDILGAAQEGDFIAWWRNEGGNPINWTKLIIDDNFNGATSVVAVDIDKDKDIDVVGSAWQANQIAIWINNGENPIGWTKYVIKYGFHFAHEAYCYDLDKDGDIDILGASTDDNQIAWWRNDGGDPISWTEQIIGSNFLGAKSARVEDFDKDGLLDVVGAAFYDDKIIWWRNSGGEPIVWQENIIVDDLDGSHRVEVIDMDFDGDIDIVSAAYHDAEISWWRNDGGDPISWTKQVVTTYFRGACIGLPVDIDDDGDIDIVGTAQQGYDVAVFRNDGGEPIQWTKIVIDTNFYGAWPGYVTDIDSDGDIDIVAGASWQDTLAWWESDLNKQPTKPEISGPVKGKAGISYDYTFKSVDPNSDDIYFYILWDDGHSEMWEGPYSSGTDVIFAHTYAKEGKYTIKAKAKDIHGVESDWSEFIVTMPRYKTISSLLPLKLLAQFPLVRFLFLKFTIF